MAAALGCALSALALPVVAQPEEQDNWKFQIAPYLWVANLDVNTSLPQTGGASSANPQHFDTSLSAGFMLAAEVQYRSVGVLADFNWLQLNTKSVNSGPLNTSVNLRSDYIYSTAALTYSLPLEGKFLAGPGYQFADWGLVTLGYRYLHQEYNHSDFSFNANAQGFLLGVAFQF